MVYPAALIDTSTNPDAARILAFVTGSKQDLVEQGFAILTK
jgi:hypothetical protein